MKRFLIMVIAALFTVVTAMPSEGKRATGPSKPSSPSCASCHPDFEAVLPGGHDSVRGSTIRDCLACHTPESGEKPSPNVFCAKLHRPHLQQPSKVGCTGCHTWTPGKALGLPGITRSFGGPSKEEMELLKQVFSTWAGSPYLASLHGKKDVTCSGCHGDALPAKGDTVENRRCFECHGSAEKLVERTAPRDFPDRNPHLSHLGEINCTVCHRAHEASAVYCLDCHKRFEMKIPGAR